MVTDMQEQLLEFIRKRKTISQSNIIKEFEYRFGYKTKISARNGIGQLLKKIENEGYIISFQKKSGKGIPNNMWKVNKDGRIQTIPR